MHRGTNLPRMLGSFSPYPLSGENFDQFYVNTYKARGNDPVKKIYKIRGKLIVVQK